MKHLLLALLLLTACAPKAETLDSPLVAQMRAGQQAGGATFDHAVLDKLLVAHVTPEGLVRYGGLKGDRAALDGYIKEVGAADMQTLNGAEQQALLINAYNALTLALILDNLPSGITSIREINDPWGKRRWRVAGHTLSLDDIEHGLLRPVFKDPRVHFAVNCASIGCPPLRTRAFQAATLDQDLDAATRAALARPAWCEVKDGKLHLTKLLEWYGADLTAPDFAPRADTVPAWVARYAPPDVAALVKQHGGAPPTKFLEYNWKLNDADPAERDLKIRTQ